jgi:hypothetical protein
MSRGKLPAPLPALYIKSGLYELYSEIHLYSIAYGFESIVWDNTVFGTSGISVS